MALKDKRVCRFCKYYHKSAYPLLNGTCDYILLTKKSRLRVEMEMGGLRMDSCPCYEKEHFDKPIKRG